MRKLLPLVLFALMGCGHTDDQNSSKTAEDNGSLPSDFGFTDDELENIELLNEVTRKVLEIIDVRSDPAELIEDENSSNTVEDNGSPPADPRPPLMVRLGSIEESVRIIEESFGELGEDENSSNTAVPNFADPKGTVHVFTRGYEGSASFAEGDYLALETDDEVAGIPMRQYYRAKTARDNVAIDPAQLLKLKQSNDNWEVFSRPPQTPDYKKVIHRASGKSVVSPPGNPEEQAEALEAKKKEAELENAKRLGDNPPRG